MALSKHLREEIKAIKPVSGNQAARWQQYSEIMQQYEHEAVKEALDALHRAIAKQLRL